MISSTFIHKYKPYFIDDFCIDDAIKQTLHTLLELDQLNLLFIGNPSSGKTSLLYALIREYYNLGKTASLPENNIMFINNLKEQGIQYFRNDMKTFCQSHSVISGKKKLVIIDDMDTINEQSQQVFRNYIDKYKHNIHFIAVCTNVQKVIESYQSRVHIVNIPLPSISHIETIMNRIVETEEIDIDDESKAYLIQNSNRSIRVVINYLEKFFLLRQPVTLELCKQICSNLSFLHFENYVDLVNSGRLMEAIQVLYEIYD